LKKDIRFIMNFTYKQHNSLFYRLFSCVIILAFLANLCMFPSTVYAQNFQNTILNLPIPGAMVSTTQSFVPTMVRGITVYPDRPFYFDFIVDTGDTGIEDKELKEESTKLIKYFLASLTIPEENMWVNLSPYEKDRIIPEAFGDTEMGRDLLAQDYLLKQLTASLMYPEDELGEAFWDKIYAKALQEYGTTQIPMDTFNKVWIVPEKAVVYEHDQSVFVIESKLKVMLEEDYLAMDYFVGNGRDRSVQSPIRIVQSEIIQEIIIPAIEKEVNEGKNFSNLRQIYNSTILATWYKMKLKDSMLGQVYIDQNKTQGVDTQDKQINQKIYDQYIKSFKKGVYNYIKEDYDPKRQEIIPRKYFSGGAQFAASSILVVKEHINPEQDPESGKIYIVSSPIGSTSISERATFINRFIQESNEARRDMLQNLNTVRIFGVRTEINEGIVLIKVKDQSRVDEDVYTLNQDTGQLTQITYTNGVAVTINDEDVYRDFDVTYNGKSIELIFNQEVNISNKMLQEGIDSLSADDKEILYILANPFVAKAFDVWKKPEEFIARTENPYWLDMLERMRSFNRNILAIDPNLVNILSKPFRLFSKFKIVKGLKNIAGEIVGISILFNRATHNIFKGPGKGGIRWMTAEDLLEDSAFVRVFEEFKKLNPTEEQILKLIHKWLNGEALALSSGMTLKTAPFDIQLGGGKGTVFLGQISKDGNGEWKLIDEFTWTEKEGMSEEEISIIKDNSALVARAHNRLLSEAGVVGIDKDIPASDMMTNAEILAWYADDYIEFSQDEIVAEYPDFSDVFEDINRKKKNIDYGVTDVPYLEAVTKYWKEKNVPMPWLGVYTGKPLEYGGALGRTEATGFGVGDIMMGILSLTGMKRSKILDEYDLKKHYKLDKNFKDPFLRTLFKGKSLTDLRMAIHGGGNVALYHALYAVQMGIDIRVIGVRGITLILKEGQRWSEEEIQRMIEAGGKKGLFRAWQARAINKDKVTVLTVEKYGREELTKAVVGADVDILSLSSKEGVIIEHNAQDIKAPIILEGANGAVDARGGQNMPIDTIILHDTLANAGGVLVSSFETLQAVLGKSFTLKTIRKMRKDQLLKTLVKTIEARINRQGEITRTFRDAGDLLSAKELIKARYTALLNKFDGDFERFRDEAWVSDRKSVSLATLEVFESRIENAGLTELLKSVRETAYNELKGEIREIENKKTADILLGWFQLEFKKTPNEVLVDMRALVYTLNGIERRLQNGALGYEDSRTAGNQRNALADKLRRSRLKDDPDIKRIVRKLKKTDPPLKKIPVSQGGSSPLIAGNTSKEVGGVDLNPALMNLRVQGDGKGNFEPINVDSVSSPINGLTPMIINITPVPSMLPLLGFNDEDSDNIFPLQIGELSYN